MCVRKWKGGGILSSRGRQTMKTYLYTTSFIDVILQKYLYFFKQFMLVYSALALLFEIIALQACKDLPYITKNSIIFLQEPI